MKKFGTRLLTAAIASSLIVTPVIAAPSTEGLEKDKAAAQSEMNSLQSQLQSVMSELGEIENDLIKVGEEITKKEGELAEAEEIEKQQYEDMKLRIKFMYEAGDVSMLESLVTSEDFTDLINTAEYVQNVHTYDREKLDEYVETKKKIADLKTTLEEDQKKIEEKQTEFQEKGENLNSLIASKSEEIASLDAEIQEAAAAAAREEAERQRQEQAAQNNNNNGGGGRPNNGGGGNIGGGNVGGNPPDYNAPVGGSVVSRAYSKLGAPYVWGAVGPNSFDCSGFVSFCLTGSYTRIGTTYTFLAWPRVSNPQPGDVVTTATHCGIYIGGGQMIHAPHTGDVVKVSPVQSGMVYVRRP